MLITAIVLEFDRGAYRVGERRVLPCPGEQPAEFRPLAWRGCYADARRYALTQAALHGVPLRDTVMEPVQAPKSARGERR